MKKANFIDIGVKLKSFREEAGLTQSVAAMYLGVTKTTVSSWETGHKLPSSENLDRMVVAYRIPSSYIAVIASLVEMSKNDLIKTILDMMNESSDPHSEDV